MQVFECPNCKKAWSFSEIIPSLLKYGFINLISPDDEIIAFNCPQKECASLIAHNTRPEGSKEFYGDVINELDPSAGGDYCGRFRFLSSVPFSKESSGLLKSFGIVEMELPLFEGYYPKFNLSDKNYYCSFNRDITETFGLNCIDLYYGKDDIHKLFAIENNNKQRLFPRYYYDSDLFYYLGEFFSEFFSESHRSSLIDFSRRYVEFYNEVVGLSVREHDYNALCNDLRSKDDKYSDFFVTLPNLFYKILCSELLKLHPEDLPFIDANSKELQKKHVKIVNGTNLPFSEGKLHHVLTTLAYEFVNEFIGEFNQHNLCHESVWALKEKYLSKIYKAWQTGSLTKQKQRKLRPDQRARLACRAIATKLWEDNPEITKREMSERPELRDACQGAYTDETRYEYIKTVVGPNSKPGRPRKKK